MSIKVIEVIALHHSFIWLGNPVGCGDWLWAARRQVPGVEADDVIGTLAVRSVDTGYKVKFWKETIFEQKWHSGIMFSFW